MFESFLEWADEAGLPFRSWADGLQEKGIPPIALVVIPLLLIAGGAFYLLNQAPATGSVVITATTFAGEPLPGVSVTLTNLQEFKAQGTSDAQGKVTFDKAPAGKVNVNAFSSSVVFLEPNFDLTVKAGLTVRKSVSASLQEAQGVELRVDVQAADAPTLTLLDANGVLVDKVAEQTSYSFGVAKNTAYVVKAEQDGFLSDERRVSIGESTEYVTLTPQQIGKVLPARLHVRVVQEGPGGKPLGNASVRVFQGEALVRSAESSDDGSVPPLSVGLNSSLRVLVSAAGFEEGALDVNVSRQDQTVSIALSLLQPSFSGVRITVKDAAGNGIYSPIVRLYSGAKMVGEQLPDEGVALFNVSWSSGLGVSVYKAGFLPIFISKVKKDQLVVLESSDNRSARVRVHVTDRRGNDAARVSVSLWDDAASRPLGIPARMTSEDGVQVFDDIPLKPLRAIASDGVRSKSSGVFVPASFDVENESVIELQLDAVAVSVSVSVLDHFLRQPISNARVISSNESCTTNVKGSCSLPVLENDAAAFSVSASGYSTLETTSLSVYSGVPAFTFDLTSDAVVKNVRLRFDGVFDAFGRKVNALSPLSEYEARYAIVSPGVDFAKADAFIALDGDAVLLGGQSTGARISKGDVQSVSTVADVPPVGISADGFSLPSFEVEQGGSVWFVNEDNVTHFIVFDDGQSVTIPDGQNRSVVFNQVGGFSFKSMRNSQLSGFVTVSAKASLDVADASNLLFEYAAFNGTRQITARFRTGSSGQVVLSHRSAFFTSIETLKSPVDGVSESARFKIDFAGTCTEQVCVQWYFMFNGRKVPSLELPFGQKASLVVNVFGLARDGVVGVAPGTPALKVLSGTTNSSLAVISGSSAQLRVGSGASSSEFSFQAVRLSQDASLKINVSDGRLVLFEADAFVVVYSPTQPALVVSVKPNRVDALESSKIVFTLKDSLGQAVEGARVALQDIEAEESTTAAGQYVVEEIQPESLAPIPFEVTKDGFRPFSGSISVDAPQQAVDVTPASVSLNVDSKESASSSIQVSNKLADKLRASISVTLDAGGDITDVSTSTTSLLLPARGSASFELTAAIKESVLELASKAGQLKEKVRGTIHVRVSGKGFSETRDVAFSVDAASSQSPIAEAWTLSPDSLQFNLEPPRDKSASVEMTVANNGPYPMVFNVEQTLGLSVQPASLTVASGGQDTFFVKAFLPREIDCFSSDLQKRGALTVYGSFQGLSSKKSAQINLDVSTARLACQPPNGYRVILPVDIKLEFLANARMKTNPDGSTSVLLPTRELLWFGTGASVTPIDATVPENTPFVLDRRFVQSLPEGGWTVAFPTAVTLQLPSDADYQPFGAGQTIVTLDNAQIILPSGVQTPQQQPNVRLSASGVRVPPLQPVTFRRIPFNYDALQNVLPVDPIEIKLPTDATLELLPGTVERKIVQPKSNPLNYLPRPQAEQNLQNLKSIQLPNGERMAFGDAVGIDLPQLRLTLPAGTSFFVSRSRVNAVKGRPIEESFELRMPVSYALNVQGTPKSFKTQEGKNALKLTDEAAVEAVWALTVSKQQSASVLRVARDNALTYLTGASARIPFDPASVAKCSFTYAPPSSVAFSLPTGTVVQKTSKGYEAILPACDDSSRIVFSVTDSSSGTLEVFQSPSVKKIVFAADSEFTVGDAADAEEKSIRTSDSLELTACLKDAAGKDVSETLREAKVSFAENSLVFMPERVLASFRENQNDVDFGVLTPVSLGSKSGALTQLGSTKKMTIHPNGQKVTAAFPPAYLSSGLLMPKGSALSFLPVCEKGSGRLDISTSAEDVYVALDKDGKVGTLDVTFSNKRPDLFKQTKEICLFNNGKQSVTLTGVRAEPAQSVAAEHTDYFKAIAGAELPDTTVPSEKAFFAGQDGKRQRINVEASVEGKDNCRRFTFELKLPGDVLFKEKCIAQNKVPTSMEGHYDFTFNDVNGDPVAVSEKHRMPLKMIFDAKEEDCQAVQEEKQFEDLAGISVNYDSKELADISASGEDKLYFKDAGHTRFFAIVNNEEKPIQVKQLRGDGVPLMTCTRVGDSSAGFPLQAGAQIGPADTMLLSCVSNLGSAGKQGQYAIDFSGESYRLEKIVSVHVWDPGSLRNLYPYTPIGRTVPFFDPSQASVKEKGKLDTAPLQTLAFADPSPTPSPSPEPVADAQKTEEQKQADLKAQQKANAENSRNVLDFRLCKKFFCTGDQADKAIRSFTDLFRKMIDQRLIKDGQAVELSGLQAFCSQLEGDGQTAFTKSMLLQLTNVELSKDNSLTQSLALAQVLKSKYFSDIKEVHVSAPSGSVLFSGCGIYRVTARLDPACAVKGATPSEWKNNMRVEMEITKLQACPVNLANAALLTADTPVSYSGNQLGTGSSLGAIKQVFSANTLNAVGGLARSAFDSGDKSKVASLLDSVGRLRQGVLGTYGSEANDKDALTVKFAYASLYGVDAEKSKDIKYCLKTGFESRPCPAVPYEDTNFCWRTGGPVLAGWGTTVTALALFQSIAAANPATVAASGGLPLLVGVRSFFTNYRLITAASGCGAGALSEKFQGRSSLSCRALESCTSSVIAGAVEMANPFFGGWKPVQAEVNLLRSPPFGSAAMSGAGSFALQSLIGGSAVSYLETLAGPDSSTTPPVVPITLITRQLASPNKVYGGYIRTKQFLVDLVPGNAEAQSVEKLTNSLAAQGLYGQAGRRTAAEAVRAFYAAGGGDSSKAFDNAVFRIMAQLTPKEKDGILKLKTPSEQYAALSKAFVAKEPLAARELFLKGVNLDDNKQIVILLQSLLDDSGMKSATQAMLSGAPTYKPSLFSPRSLGSANPLDEPFVIANRDYLLKQFTSTDPKDSKFLVAVDAQSASAKFMTGGMHSFQTLTLSDRLLPLKDETEALLKAKLNLPLDADEKLVKTTLDGMSPSTKNQLLLTMKKESPYLQIISETGIDKDLDAKLRSLVTDGKVISHGEVADKLISYYPDKLSFGQLDRALTKRGAVSLGPSFGGLSSLMESGLEDAGLNGFYKGAKTPGSRLKSLSDLQLYDAKGKPFYLDPTKLDAFEVALADQQKAARQLLNADTKARFVRGASAFAAFLSAFLFNTDFRPVQVQVLSDQTSSHIIAVHSEKGRPSAESICIKGVSGSCDPQSVEGNVLSVSSLCGKSGVCLRLLSWPSSTRQSYGLVVGFNDDAKIDPALLDSVFLPEKAPVSSADLQRLNIPSGLSINYLPLTAAGFDEYQPEAPNPQVTARQVQNRSRFKRPLPDADRRNVISLANQAISALRAGKDAEGLAKLRQADAAEGRLLSQGITGGPSR